MKSTRIPVKSAVLALTTLSLMTGAALAQPRISAQSIIVNPVETQLDVRVWTDKDLSGMQTPAYREGDRIKLSVSPTRDAYVYLFNVGAAGEVDLLLPNSMNAGGNFVKANQTKTFPDAGDNFTFDVSGPLGLNKVLAVASLTPLDLSTLATFKSGQAGFASVNVQGEARFAQALSIVVNPVQQNSWTSATAYYQVQARAVRPGTLTVTSNAPGSVVEITGSGRYAAGQSVSLAPGNYAVKVSAPGYTSYSTTLTIRSNEGTRLAATLNRTAVASPLPMPAPQPSTNQGAAPIILDLFRQLLGVAAPQVTVTPVRAAYDQQVQMLQDEGYRLTSSTQVTGGFRGEFSGPEGTATLNVMAGSGRTVSVKVERSALYRY